MYDPASRSGRPIVSMPMNGSLLLQMSACCCRIHSPTSCAISYRRDRKFFEAKNRTMTALTINDITSDFRHDIAYKNGCQGSSGCQGTKSNPGLLFFIDQAAAECCEETDRCIVCDSCARRLDLPKKVSDTFKNALSEFPQIEFCTMTP